MINRIVKLLLVLLVTACGQVTPSPIEPPTTTIQSDVARTFSPSISPTPVPPVITAPTVAPLVQSNLAVITSSNARDLDKITVLAGHTDRIADLAFSGDGVYLASAGYEGKIRLWDINTWREVYTFPISDGDLNSIAFSPDGSLLASGQAIWNITTREIIHTLDDRLAGSSHVAFSPDGEWLAAWSGGNGTVYFWSAETGQLAFALQQGNEYDVHDIDFTPDGQLFATGGTDNYARLWDITNGENVRKMPLVGMYSLAISPDRTLLATAGPDRKVSLWDVQTGRLLAALYHPDELMAVAFSPDDRLIAAGGYDNSIVVWGISQ